MALQQFVSQVETQANNAPVRSEPSATNSNISMAPHPAQPNRKQNEAHSSVAMKTEQVGSVDTRNVLSQGDQQTLMALAAVQIRYGRPAEAVPYLTMIRKLNPENAEASRILALALIKLEHWDQAEIILDELDALNVNGADNPTSGIMMLYRSLVSFRKNRFDEAKSWFSRFRAFCSGRMRA